LQSGALRISVARSRWRGSRGQEHSEDHFDIEAEWRTRALGSVADGAAAFGGARVEIDRLADTAEIVAAQDLADRVSAMLTKLIRSV